MPNNSHSFRLLPFVSHQGADALHANDSHICRRAPSAPLPRAAAIDYLDARDLLDELCEDQLTLSVNLSCLDELVAAGPPGAAARTALRILAARLADLAALRDALATVQLWTIDPRLQRIAVPDSALADYLRGIYAWAHAVVRALEHLVGSLRGQPDWALLRWRVEQAKNFHFDELHEAIRNDLMELTVVTNGGAFGTSRPPVADLHYAVERLIATAVALEEHLDERFG